jgi:hypothetical protein
MRCADGESSPAAVCAAEPEELGMLAGLTADVEALTPPFIMCVAVIIAVVVFLRHQMAPAPKKRSGQDTDVSHHTGDDE